MSSPYDVDKHMKYMILYSSPNREAEEAVPPPEPEFIEAYYVFFWCWFVGCMLLLLFFNERHRGRRLYTTRVRALSSAELGHILHHARNGLGRSNIFIYCVWEEYAYKSGAGGEYGNGEVWVG